MGNQCSGSSYEAAAKRKQRLDISLNNHEPSCLSSTDIQRKSARSVATEVDIQTANRGIQCQLLDSSTAVHNDFSPTKLCHCLCRSSTLSKPQSDDIISQLNGDNQADYNVLLNSSHNPPLSVGGLHGISDIHGTAVLNFLPRIAAAQVWNKSRISHCSEPCGLGQVRYGTYPPTGTTDKCVHHRLSAQELPISKTSSTNASLINWNEQLHIGNDNRTTTKLVSMTNSGNVQAYGDQNFSGLQTANQLLERASAKQFFTDGTTDPNSVCIQCSDKGNALEPEFWPLSCRCKSVPTLPTHCCKEKRTCPQTNSNGIQTFHPDKSCLIRCNSCSTLKDIRSLNHALMKQAYRPPIPQKPGRLLHSPELTHHYSTSCTGPEQPNETSLCRISKLKDPECHREPDPVNTFHDCYLLSPSFETPDINTSILREVIPSKNLGPKPDFTEFEQTQNEPRHALSMRSSELATNEDLSVLSPTHCFKPVSVTFHPKMYTCHLSGSQPSFVSLVQCHRPVTRVFEENQTSHHKHLRYVPQQVARTCNPSTCEQVAFSHSHVMDKGTVVPIPYKLSHSPSTCYQVAKSWYPVGMEPVKTSPTRSLVAKSSCGAGKRLRSTSQTEPAKRTVKTDTNVSNTNLFYASQPRGLLKYRFFLKDCYGIDKVIADPTDRRIRAICDRFQCDLEVYSKVPKNGYMQFVIDISSPSLWALHSCTRALDSSLNWCLSPQLLRSCSNGLPPK